MATSRSSVPLHLTDQALARDLGGGDHPTRRRAELLLQVPANGREAVVADARHSTPEQGGYRLTDLELAVAAYLGGLPLAGDAAQRLDPRDCDECHELLSDEVPG